MTQVWVDDKVVPVTKVQAGPCFVVQKKSENKDGYTSVQLGFGSKKEKNIKKPQLGHLKKVGTETTNFRYLREFRIEAEEVEKLNIGDNIKADTFETGDIVDVIGTSKGKGFAGVVKRHGFKGSKKTHGNKDQLRMPGSIGATGPAHVFKGTRMGGRMGGDRVTEKNLEIIEVDGPNNILLIKGAVPGARNSLVLVKGDGELKVEEMKKVKKEEVKKEIKPVPEKMEEKKEEPKKEVKEEKKEEKK